MAGKHIASVAFKTCRALVELGLVCALEITSNNRVLCFDSTEWVSVVSLSHENRLWLCFEMKDGFQMPISVCFRQWIDEQEIWNKKIEEAAFDQD